MPFVFWNTRFNSLVVSQVFGHGSGLDFNTFYLAGRLWLSQGNPYNVNGIATGFVYPPAFLPFFGVLALFDFNFANQVWWIAYFSLFVIALLALAIRLKGERRCVYVSFAVLFILTSHPLIWLFYLGQSDLLIAGLAILSLVCERLKHRFASAALLSTATLLKGPAVLLLVYFVVFRRDLRYLACFVIFALAVLGVSSFVVPIGLYWYYVMNVLPFLISFGLDSNQPITVASLAINPVVSIVVFVLFGIFAVWVSSKNMVSDEKELRADAMFLMNVLVMLLLLLKSAIYPYVWVILPLSLFLSSLLAEEVKMKYLILVCCAVFLLNSILAPDFISTTPTLGQFISDRIHFPLELVGNLMMTLSLIPIFTHPNIILQSVKRRVIGSKHV